MGVTEITDLAQFKAALKDAGDKLVVVDFTATWCGPCQMIGPVFHDQSLLPENANVIFLKVDVDKAQDVSAECKISCMPTFFFYKNGEKVTELTGADKVKLIQNVKSLRT